MNTRAKLSVLDLIKTSSLKQGKSKKSISYDFTASPMFSGLMTGINSSNGIKENTGTLAGDKTTGNKKIFIPIRNAQTTAQVTKNETVNNKNISGYDFAVTRGITDLTSKQQNIPVKNTIIKNQKTEKIHKSDTGNTTEPNNFGVKQNSLKTDTNINVKKSSLINTLKTQNKEQEKSGNRDKQTVKKTELSDQTLKSLVSKEMENLTNEKRETEPVKKVVENHFVKESKKEQDANNVRISEKINTGDLNKTTKSENPVQQKTSTVEHEEVKISEKPMTKQVDSGLKAETIKTETPGPFQGKTNAGVKKEFQYSVIKEKVQFNKVEQKAENITVKTAKNTESNKTVTRENNDNGIKFQNSKSTPTFRAKEENTERVSRNAEIKSVKIEEPKNEYVQRFENTRHEKPEKQTTEQKLNEAVNREGLKTGTKFNDSNTSKTFAVKSSDAGRNTVTTDKPQMNESVKSENSIPKVQVRSEQNQENRINRQENSEPVLRKDTNADLKTSDLKKPVFDMLTNKNEEITEKVKTSETAKNPFQDPKIENYRKDYFNKPVKNQTKPTMFEKSTRTEGETSKTVLSEKMNMTEKIQEKVVMPAPQNPVTRSEGKTERPVNKPISQNMPTEQKNTEQNKTTADIPNKSNPATRLNADTTRFSSRIAQVQEIKNEMTEEHDFEKQVNTNINASTKTNTVITNQPVTGNREIKDVSQKTHLPENTGNSIITPSGLSSTNIAANIVHSVSQIFYAAKIGNSIKTSFKIDGGDLGDLELQFKKDYEGNSAKIIVMSEATKSVILKMLPVIQNDLIEKGISLTSIDVEINDTAQNNNSAHMQNQRQNKHSLIQNDADISDRIALEKKIKDYGYNSMEVVA